MTRFFLKHKNILTWLGFVFLALFSLRKILLSTYHLGHNWDFSLPYSEQLFLNISKMSLYTWWQLDLGKDLNFTISQLIPNLLVANLAHFLSPVLIQRLLIVFSILFSIFTFNVLAKLLVGKERNYYVAALLYGFSPFLFNDIISGSWYMWISYAFIPLFLFSLIRISRDGFARNSLMVIASSIFVIISLQNFVAILALALLFISIEGIQKHKIAIYLERYVITGVTLLLTNFYWIFVMLYTLQSVGNRVLSNDSFSSNFFSVANSNQSIANILNLAGYLDRNMYLDAVPKGLLFLILTSASIVWILIVLSIINGRHRTRKNLLIWSAVLLASTLIVKGGNHPLSLVTMELYRGIPAMNLFRSPQHLMMVPSLLTPILLAFISKINEKNFGLKFIYIIAVMLWISGWWFTGDIGSGILAGKSLDRINLYKLPPDLTALYETNSRLDLSHRILFLPAVNSPYFVNNSFQNGGQGGQPEYMYLKNPTMNTEYNYFASTLEYRFCSEEQWNYVNLATLLNIKYLALRNDINPKFSRCANRWNYTSAKKELSNNPKLHNISNGETVGVYEIVDSVFLPRIYLATSSAMVANLDSLISIASTANFDSRRAVVVRNQNQEFEGILSQLEDVGAFNPGTIEFRPLDPTKYRVMIHKGESLSALIFSENFNSRWRIYLGDPIKSVLSTQAKITINQDDQELQANLQELNDYLHSGKLSGIDKSKLEQGSYAYISKEIQGVIQNNNLLKGNIFETFHSEIVSARRKHFMVNGYANGWLLDLQEICQQYKDHCIKNADGTYEVEIIISYSPQNYLYVGMAVSLVALTTVLFISILFEKSKRKDRNK